MCDCYDSRGRNVWQLLQLLQGSQMCPQTYTLFLTSLENWPRGSEHWSASNYRGGKIRVSEFQVFLSATSAVLWSALQIIDVKERWKDWRRQNLTRTKKQRIKKWNQEEWEEKAHTSLKMDFSSKEIAFSTRSDTVNWASHQCCYEVAKHREASEGRIVRWRVEIAPACKWYGFYVKGGHLLYPSSCSQVFTWDLSCSVLLWVLRARLSIWSTHFCPLGSSSTERDQNVHSHLSPAPA